MITLVYALILCIAVITAASLFVATLKTGISPMPSSRAASEAMAQLFDPQFDGKIFDLGSGFGNLIFPIARRCPQAQIVGYENSLVPYLYAQFRRLIGGYKNVTVIYRDFFDVDLKSADAVICYLFPKAMQALAPKMSREVRKGVRILSNTFHLPGWPLQESLPLKGWLSVEILIYES